MITGPLRGDVLAPDPAQPEVDVEERLEDQPGRASRRSGWRPAPARAGADDRDPSHIGVPGRRRARYSCGALSPGIDRTRTLRGAVCGAVAAAVWALQQPLDKLVVRQPLSTTSSCSARRSPAATAGTRSGFAMHIGQRRRCSAPSTPTSRPRCRCRRPLRGPVVALAEHVALWPLARAHRPLPPGARASCPGSRGNRRGVRPGDLAPPAVRARARRARAARQRRARAGPARARGRLLQQRPRLARARRVGRARPDEPRPSSGAPCGS